jgi:hypothetical protein
VLPSDRRCHTAVMVDIGREHARQLGERKYRQHAAGGEFADDDDE